MTLDKIWGQILMQRWILWFQVLTDTEYIDKMFLYLYFIRELDEIKPCMETAFPETLLLKDENWETKRQLPD